MPEKREEYPYKFFWLYLFTELEDEVKDKNDYKAMYNFITAKLLKCSKTVGNSQKFVDALMEFENPIEKFLGLLALSYLEMSEDILEKAINIMLREKNKNVQEKMFKALLYSYKFYSYKISMKILNLLKKFEYKYELYIQFLENFKDYCNDLRVLKKAEKFIKKFQDNEQLLGSYFMRADIYVESKEYEMASKILDLVLYIIEEEKKKRTIKNLDIWICHFISLYCDCGQLKEAQKLLKYLEDEKRKSSEWTKIARGYISQGKIKNALSLIPKISDEMDKDLVLERVALAYAKRKKFKEALDILEKIEGTVIPIDEFIQWLIDIFAESGSTDREIFKRILNLIKLYLKDSPEEINKMEKEITQFIEKKLSIRDG